jgi:hypothetical protein
MYVKIECVENSTEPILKRTIVNKPIEMRLEPRQYCKEKLYYYIIQKAVGVILAALGAITIWLSKGDITGFVFMIVFAFPLIFSKNKILMFGYFFNEEDE